MQPEEKSPQDLLKEKIMTELSNSPSSDILFEKKDKSVRALTGTRNIDTIPLEKRPKTDKVASGISIPVFDLELNEWRAFRLDNLISINGTDYKEEIKQIFNEDTK